MDDLLDSHYQMQISTSVLSSFYITYITLYMYTIIIHKTTLTLLIQ